MCGFPGCSRPIPKRNRLKGILYCTLRCQKAAQADMKHEAESLSAAESGEGMERLYEAEFHRTNPDE